MWSKPSSDGPILTSEQDYLAFGCSYGGMLQEPSSSKGPRVPRSIHSTHHFDKTWGSTLMRLTVDHGIPEFLDLGCPVVEVGRSSDECPRTGGFGLFSPRQVGYLRSIKVTWARSRGLALHGVSLDSVHGPSTRIWHGQVHHTPGTPLHAPSAVYSRVRSPRCPAWRNSAMGS